MVAALEFRLLGPVDLMAGGQSILPGSTRQRDLLALLLLDANRVVSFERLIDRMWEGNPPATATAALQVYVAKLRKLLAEQGTDRPASITTRNGGYSLQVDRASIDAACFEELVKRGRTALAAGSARSAAGSLTEALALWQGEALADVRHLDGAQIEATRLEELRASTLADRIDAQLALGEHSRLIAELEGLVETDPLRERHWGQLMVALYREGRQADALRTYRRAAEVLGDQLGIEPGPNLQQLEERILLQDPALSTPRTDARRLTNLGRRLTSFVGRDEELHRVVTLVRGHPLVTLTGPSGSGKTRLAVEVADTLLPEIPDGVWQVDLAPVAKPDLVPYRLAEALQLTEQAGTPVLETVVEHLETRNLLLLLDNCEHLLEAAAHLVQAVLVRCPHVKVLATSRERLRLSGETTWTVPPLAFPAAASDTDVRDGNFDAVDLFVARARLVDDEFRLRPENAGVIGDICRRLDGLPLAIELAAARTYVLSVGDISRRLADRFALLDRRSLFEPLRHATLRAAIQWSYDLLGPLEQALFRRLAVLNGRFTLEDVEQTCTCEDIPDSDVLNLLSRLVDKSLVMAFKDGDAPARYSLLESLREFAVEYAAAEGEVDEVSLLHAQRFVNLAEMAEAELQGSQQQAWLDRLEADHDNLRSAFDWLLSSGRVEEALRLASALRWFWKMRDHASEGAERLERALEAADGASETVRARARMAAGALRSSSDLERAVRHLDESVQLAEGAGDRLTHGLALGWLGLLDRMGNRLDRSRQRLEDSLQLLESTGEGWAEAFALGHLGVVARERGDLEAAAAYHERALDLDRRAGNEQDEAWNLAGLGLVHLYGGDHETAQPLLERSLEVHRRLRFDFETASLAVLLAVSKARAGWPGEASAYLLEATDLARRLGSARLRDATLRGQATVALTEGELHRAAELLGAAEQVRENAGLSRSMFQRLFEEDTARLAGDLPPDDLEQNLRDGRAAVSRLG